MKRKANDSKLNVLLTALLIVFICLLSFSIGVISGKGWSDRNYKVKHIEQDSHLHQAMENSRPVGEEMTAKEVELLTERALAEAKAELPKMEEEKPMDPNMMADGSMKTQGTIEKNSDQKPMAEKIKEDLEKQTGLPPGKVAKNEKTANKKNMTVNPSNNKASTKLPPKERNISSLPPRPTVSRPETINYTVQVAAYKTIDEAENHSQKLIDRGFPAFPMKDVVKGKEWFKVGIGSFKNRKQAMKYEKALKKQAVIKSSFILKIKRQVTK